MSLARDGLGWETPVPWTTRAPRDHEVDGRDHHFCDVQHFQAKIEAGEMSFWDYTLRNYYGYDITLPERCTKATPCMVAALARMGLRMAHALPDTATVFLDAGDDAVLRVRVNERYRDPEERSLREGHWREEQAHAPMFSLRLGEAELADADVTLGLLSQLASSLR
jgi:guanylate kinase